MPYKDKDKRRECNLKSQKKYYENNKEYFQSRDKLKKKSLKAQLLEYKSTLKCKICGENEPVCLDFHHQDPSMKDITIAQAVVKKWSFEKIKDEIEKCIVLCANCHRKVHYKKDFLLNCGLEKQLSHMAHDHGITGANPVPATN